MAEQFFPFEDSLAYEDQWALMAPMWVATGVRRGYLNQLEVYADGLAMVAKVKSGASWIEGFYYQSDAERVLTVTTAHATLPRIDTVIAKWDRTASPTTYSTYVKAGTPGASPVAPTLTQSTTVYEMALADVLVSAAVGTIAAGKVTDRRTYAGSAAANLAGATLAANVLASSLTSVGTLSSLTVGGLLTASAGFALTGTLTLATAASKVVPGATSLSFRNNADSADNLIITNAGAVTVRTSLAIGTILALGGASGVINGGTAQINFNNNASNATNLTITDAGGVTIPRAGLTINGTAGIIPVNLAADGATLATHHIRMAGYCGIQSTTSGAQVWLMSNSTYDATNYRYVTTFPAAQIFMGSGAISFSVAPSGTAGAIIGFTTAMDIAATTGLVTAYQGLVVNAVGLTVLAGATKLAGSYTTPVVYTPAAAGTATINLALGDIAHITMPAGNITIALSNPQIGQCFLVRILQDGTGSRTVTWFGTIRWAGGSAPVLTVAANKADTIGFECTGAGTYDGFVLGQGI